MKMIHFDHQAARIIVSEELQRARQLIINHIRANGQNASGKTIKSLHVEANEDEGVLYGHKPFGILETGRKAGKIPYSFRSIIYQWMQDKGVHGIPIPYKGQGDHKWTPQERGDLRMAGAIAYTIQHRGSRLHRQGGRADVYSNVVPQTLERVRSRLIRLINTQFEHIITADKRS